MAMSEKEKYPVYHDDPPSHDFTAAFPGGGGIWSVCTCGRTHVAIDSRDITESEIEWYTEQKKLDPDGYILVRDVDCVMHSYLNGRIFLDDCPCNGMRPYENLFWNCRQQYKTYLTMVKMRLLAEADNVGEWETDV
jgi:hypothetical protein